MSAEKVEVFNLDTSDVELSQREYVEVGEFVNEVSGGWGQYTKVRIPVYLDESTGLLVGDVRAYEAWVRS